MRNGQIYPEINQSAKETSVYTQGKNSNELWYLQIRVNSLPGSAARFTQSITKCPSHLPVRHSYPSRTLWACPTVLLASWRKSSWSHIGGETTANQWQPLFSPHAVSKYPGTEGGTLKMKRFWQSSSIAVRAHKIRCLTVTVIGVANWKNNYCLL